MPAKHHVELDAAARATLLQHCSSGTHAARYLLHARILLLVDGGAHGPGWTDEKAADALHCGVATVERVRRRYATDGLDAALRVRRPVPGRPPKINGAAEAQLIALACSAPPAGRARWTVRLLTDSFVDLACQHGWLGVPVGRETVRQTLKKTRCTRSA
ncbi:helix-turn-helix domain-containing protein [Hymenobacter gummosus]|uniref:Helix-turn-helix domain-containing protein n=1 Tax=Hymenobacter gummosus TaxID=1776032 RepID=A0A3S0QJ66_9BACT|nr:helix-turn-helix domain-containing protein [Hymenobacter gummosus]RTQ51387.1 helix-turn-helix domain-containing protein [Hymenobacter gummosus]